MADLKKEYYFPGNDTGCLVIHGFTSTPAEVYELGQHIHSLGFTVLGVRLKGHGTDIEDFAKSTELDWYDSVLDGYDRLRAACSKVYVAGHSMGGLLAMHTAANKPVDKLILLAPALVYRNRLTYIAVLLRCLIRNFTWPVLERPENERQYLLGYPKFPMSGVYEMTKLQQKVKKELQAITAPTLLVMARKDKLVHPSAANLIKRGISGPLQTLWLERSGHSVGVECEKGTVFKACEAFLKS